MKLNIKSEDGSILPMIAMIVVITMVVAAVAVDFGRYVLASEKLQTAGDAAATAAAMTAKRYVTLEIYPGQYLDTCCSDTGCSPCCYSCYPEKKTISGREDYLLDKKGWKNFCCSCGCDRDPKILSRWVEYEKNGDEAVAAAQTYFDMNKPKEMDSSTGGESYIKSINVHNSGPLYPSVIVRTEGKVKTLLMDFIDRMYPNTGNLSELESSRCSSAGTFYYDTHGRKVGTTRDECK